MSRREEELLVFGYGARLFRDDDRARGQESGLIPHPHNPDLLLDRLDGRVAIAAPRTWYAEALSLSERLPQSGWPSTLRLPCAVPTPAGASPGSRFDGRLHLHSPDEWEASGPAEWEGEERVEEQMCEEERWRELRLREEEAASQEEDAKRQASGAQIPFSYDEPPTDADAPPPVEEEEEEEEESRPYKPRPELKVPVGMNVPATVKANVMIEKTAAFVAAQGAQMEIVIKAKQGSNPQFGFMDWGDPLNHYYKHVLKMIRNKRYTPIPPKTKEEKAKQPVDSDDSDSDSDGSGHYLHPLLGGGASAPALLAPDSHSASQSPKPPPPKPLVNYKLGEENDIYSALFRSLSALMPKRELPSNGNGAEEKAPEAAAEEVPEVVVGAAFAPPEAKEEVPAPLSDARLRELYANAPPSDYLAWHYWFYGFYAPYPGEPTAIPPPPDLQPVVQKTAEFVYKFGPHAEAHLRNRPELQLEFLEPHHPFHPFYQVRIRWLQYEEFNRCLQAGRPAALTTWANSSRKEEPPPPVVPPPADVPPPAEDTPPVQEQAVPEAAEQAAPEGAPVLNRKQRRRKQFHDKPTSPLPAEEAPSSESEEEVVEGPALPGPQLSQPSPSSESPSPVEGPQLPVEGPLLPVVEGPLLPVEGPQLPGTSLPLIGPQIPSPSLPAAEPEPEPVEGPSLPTPSVPVEGPSLPTSQPVEAKSVPVSRSPSQSPTPLVKKRRIGFAPIGQLPSQGTAIPPPGLVVVPKPGIMIPHPLQNKAGSSPALMASVQPALPLPPRTPSPKAAPVVALSTSPSGGIQWEEFDETTAPAEEPKARTEAPEPTKDLAAEKEAQRQSERRAKAAAFLSRLKARNGDKEEGEVGDSDSSSPERRRKKKKAEVPSTYARTRLPSRDRRDSRSPSRERRRKKDKK